MEFVTEVEEVATHTSIKGSVHNLPNSSTTAQNTTKNKNKKKKKKKKKNSNAQNTLSSLTPSYQVHELDVNTVLNSPDSVNDWFQAYQTAFEEENQFIDQTVMVTAKGPSQSQSSVALGLDGATMLPLVFCSPPPIKAGTTTQFRRVCFFVYGDTPQFTSSCRGGDSSDVHVVEGKDMDEDVEGQELTATDTNEVIPEINISKTEGEEIISDTHSSPQMSAKSISQHQDTAASKRSVVAYATVDEDIQYPNGVCHIRMILVRPSHQRSGIGKQLLQHIEQRFRSRHLGLKYANCHDYKVFYGLVGFSVIGTDDKYTYMAIRR